MSEQTKIIEKIVVQGTLHAVSPLLIGSGEREEAHDVDTYVLKNMDDIPFIPGTSLAGVLRSYVRSLSQDMEQHLFGWIDTKNQGRQSAVAISDVLLQHAEIVQRDGVRIDEYTQTAIKGAKYNYEVVEAGAQGTFSMTITLRGVHAAYKTAIENMVENLVAYLRTGFSVGAQTTKGLGLVQIANVTGAYYDFSKPQDVMDWFLGKQPATISKGAVKAEKTADTFYVDAQFSLKSSLIIRDYDTKEQTKNGNEVHAVSKKSLDRYVIPGTSVKGVLRHQAMKCLRHLGLDEDDYMEKINQLMGFADGQGHKQKSRFYVQEIYLDKGVAEKEQTRNRIDRFTGGTIDTALFTTKPIWQQKQGEATVHMHYEIHQCKEWEAGLALLLLRDLWIGRAALGGEKSIGRGTLQGVSATITYQHKTYELDAKGRVIKGDAAALNHFASCVTQS